MKEGERDKLILLVVAGAFVRKKGGREGGGRQKNRINCLLINGYARSELIIHIYIYIWSERVLLSLDFNKQFQGIMRI